MPEYVEFPPRACDAHNKRPNDLWLIVWPSAVTTVPPAMIVSYFTLHLFAIDESAGDRNSDMIARVAGVVKRRRCAAGRRVTFAGIRSLDQQVEQWSDQIGSAVRAFGRAAR